MLTDEANVRRIANEEIDRRGIAPMPYQGYYAFGVDGIMQTFRFDWPSARERMENGDCDE